MAHEIRLVGIPVLQHLHELRKARCYSFVEEVLLFLGDLLNVAGFFLFASDMKLLNAPHRVYPYRHKRTIAMNCVQERCQVNT